MLSLTTLVDDSPSFTSRNEAREAMQEACARHDRVASFEVIGESEDGRPIDGVVLGTGPQTVSLIAGNHADEPVGPETLRSFVVHALDERNKMAAWFERFTFVIVPHTNPDGEARNRPWIDAWPDLEAYARHVVREEPGRDLEFGFPEMRPENRVVSEFLRRHAPLSVHASLHGMAAGEGAALLINRPWTFRTQALRDAFVHAAGSEGLRMHDHNRKGEKGFFWIEPGFQTTPRGDAMRTYFQAQGDPETASKFHASSMEYAMSLGGDPLCLVTELPLFVVENEDPEPGVPDQYLALRQRLPKVQHRLASGQPIDDLLAPFTIRPLPLESALHLQLRAVELALETVQGDVV
jgi:hypothetical protein